MGEKLFKVDVQVEANAILMERCLDSCVRICQKYATITMYGDERSVLSEDGVFRIAAAIFERVRNAEEISRIFANEQAVMDLLEEYRKETEETALEKRNADPAGHAGP